MSAPERIPPRSVTTAELLAEGELAVSGGRIRDASNAALYCTVSYDGREAACIYKPVAGERPLWDFPDGTLAQREVAAYEVSEATGWGLVPPTVLREGPTARACASCGSRGSRMPSCSPWWRARRRRGWKAIGLADVGEGGQPARARRRRAAAATGRPGRRHQQRRPQGGHLLPGGEGRLYGIDHGVTFNAENKLRTLLWAGRASR